jgi:hypothetical protein
MDKRRMDTSTDGAEEPMTRVASHMTDWDMRTLLQQRAMKDLYHPNAPPKTFEPPDLEAFRDFVALTIGDVRVNYLEFGVATGKSLRAMVSRFRSPDARFFGFDSFEGLPEDWSPHPKVSLKIGHFSQRGNTPDIGDGRVEFIKGWFQNTLPPFLAGGKVGAPCPHLVHYDADLYSATLFIATTLWHFLPAYYFVMDEFMYDEIVAFRDFAQAYPVKIRFLARSSDKLFGRVRRVAFSL